MSEPNASFGYWLRRQRKALDLTQAELAVRVGCVLTTIKKIETGARNPSPQLAERLIEALALPVHAQAVPNSALAGSAHAAPLPDSFHANSLLGRARELAALRSLVTGGNHRLVTLVGPGGVGKTRLAVEAAATLEREFVDGMWFVDLAPVRDPALVPATIARALGLESHTAPATALTRALRERRALVVLDNCEQVLGAAPFVAQLLAHAPHLVVMATSRAPLRVSYEQEFTVSPLELPPELNAHALDTYATVQLFVQRARALQPNFALTAENSAAVAAICRRLDGLPLAIELAASRLRLFSPAALLARLDKRLPLLGEGPRDRPARQQTLHATLDWSYQLLQPRQRRVFAWLGAFVGGATLEAIEAVAGSATHDLLASVTALVEQSLVRRIDSGAEPRFGMLETIREYASEQLAANGDNGSIRDRHAAYFLHVTEAAAPRLRGPNQKHWLDWLETDHDNIRAALNRLLETGKTHQALRLVGAMQWFWDRRGYLEEGRTLIETALRADAGSHESATRHARAWALIGAAALAFDQGDRASVATLAQESIPLFQAVNDAEGVTLALLRLAFALSSSDPQQAHAMLLEAQHQARLSHNPWFVGLALFITAQAALFGRGDTRAARTAISEALPALQTSGDPYQLAHGLATGGLVDFAEGQLAAARVEMEQALEIARSLDDTRSIALLAANTADIARCQGDYAPAAEGYSESLALYHKLGNHAEIPAILHNQGYVAIGMHHLEEARDLFAESLRRQKAAGNPAGIAEGITGMAALAVVQGQFERAARLFGAAEALRAAHPAPIWPAERFEIECYTRQLTTHMPASMFSQLRRESQTFSTEQAVAYALAVQHQNATRQASPRIGGLTEREREVAVLIAHGATNHAIAEALVISERTVERHVANIFAKLDFGSRAQIAAFAVQHALGSGGAAER